MGLLALVCTLALWFLVGSFFPDESTQSNPPGRTEILFGVSLRTAPWM